MKKYYVYTWTRLDLNTVFYVGKGSGSRYKDRSMRNKYFNYVVEKVGMENIRIDILEDNLEEKEAFEREIYYIEYFKKQVGDKLTNMTLGGEGSSNWYDNLTEEEKEKHKEISKSFLGKKHTEETKEKMRNSAKGRKHTDETKKKISEIRKSRKYNSYWSGRHHSEESKAKIRETRARKGLNEMPGKKVYVINKDFNVIDIVKSRTKTFEAYSQYKQHIIRKSVETNSKISKKEDVFFIEDISFIYEVDYMNILPPSTIETISLDVANENNGVEYIQGEIPCLEVRGV